MLRSTLFPLTMGLAVSVGLAPPTASAQQAASSPAGGQTAEAQWLDALPGDLPIVVRVGGLEQASNNLVAMLRAMSPQAAEQVGSQIQGAVAEITRSLGAEQGQAPVLLLIDVVPPDQLGEQIALEDAQLRIRPRAIAVFATNDYRQALSAIADRQDIQPEQREGGYEAVTADNDMNFFAVQKQGFAAVTQHEDLIRKVASTPQQTLGQMISEDLRSHFLDGDLGLYVDVATINETYGPQAEQARDFLRQRVSQIEEQNPEAAEQIRSAYRQVFAAAENARALAAHANFAEKGLSISGKLAMNEDYEPIRAMAEQGDDPADELGKLPRGAAYYAFNMLDPDSIDWDMIPSGDQIRDDFPEIAEVLDSPEFQRAGEQFRGAGQMTTAASLGLGETRKGVCVIQAENPGSLVEAVRSAVEAIQGRDFSLIRDLSIEEGAQDHRGYSFDKLTVSYDFEAFTKEIEEQTEEVKNEVQQRIDDENINRNIDQALEDRPIDREEAVRVLRRVVGESTTLWIGSNGEQVVSILAENWEDAQPQIDAYLANDQGINQTDSFQKVRAELPDRVRSLTMVDLQRGLRQVLGEARQATGDRDIQAPEQMPEQPAMIGMSMVAEPDGLRFQTFVPSEVGPVIEKGIVPLIERQLNQQGQQQGQQQQQQQRQQQ